jgi:hypothetical protein
MTSASRRSSDTLADGGLDGRVPAVRPFHGDRPSVGERWRRQDPGPVSSDGLCRVHEEEMTEIRVTGASRGERRRGPADAFAASAPACAPFIPDPPLGPSNAGTSRWEPILVLVGASSGPTSEYRNSISSARPREKTSARHLVKSSDPTPSGDKLLSTCHPVSPGSSSAGKRTTNRPRSGRGSQRRAPTSWSKAACRRGLSNADLNGRGSDGRSRATG